MATFNCCRHHSLQPAGAHGHKQVPALIPTSPSRFYQGRTIYACYKVDA